MKERKYDDIWGWVVRKDLAKEVHLNLNPGKFWVMGISASQLLWGTSLGPLRGGENGEKVYGMRLSNHLGTISCKALNAMVKVWILNPSRCRCHKSILKRCMTWSDFCSKPSFSTLALWKLGPDNSLFWGHPVHGKRSIRIPVFYPLDANGTHSPQL